MVRFVPNAVVVIDDEAVQSYIREGGAVSNLMNDVAKGVKTYSVTYLNTGAGGNRSGGNHVRSGRLRKGLFWNRTKTTGPWTGSALAGSSAKHTRYFHEGTKAEISHPNMIVPKNKRAPHTSLAFSGAGAEQLAIWAGRTEKQQARGKGVTRKSSVKGQWRKPFLDEGLAVSLAKQGLK